MEKRVSVFLSIFFLFLFASNAQTVKILFDATKAEAAGNADWVIDADAHNIGFSSGPAVLNGGNESNAQRIPVPAQSGITASTAQSFWNGALSYWAIDCVNRNYIVESLPYNGQITYGNSGNAQDLSNYKVFIVCEPNILFTAAEKTAILNFVANGGGLFMVSDHDVSDRNNDGQDSPHIWNDLMATNSVQANPFGMTFDYANFSQTTTNIPSLPTDSILNGPAGSVSQVQFSNGTSITLNPVLNSTVRGVVYKTGSAFGNTNAICAYARYGNGKVASLGDSSPCDDGSGDSNDALFDGYIADAAGNHRKLLMNITIWLATATNTSTPVANFTASPLTVCLGQSNIFTNNSSVGVTSYSWNFGSGASPATASTVGPHTIIYSTSGLKTVSLTVSNAAGSNTSTKTNYVNIDGNCSTIDLGVQSLINPISVGCPTLNNALQVRIQNYGSTSVNFANNPLSVVMQITDPASAVQAFTKNINAGTLAVGATMDVTFAGTYDLSSPGDYIFNSNTVFASDANTLNDAMTATTISVGPGFQSDFTVLSEGMGTPAGTTAISVHEANDGFENINLTMSGTADVRITTGSTGYITASGGANVFFTASGRNFIISGINTSTYSNLGLSFGILKSVGSSNGSDMQVQVSTDGTTYTNLTMPALPLNTTWNYTTVSGTIPSTPNLRLKFTTTSATQFRIDDLLLIEHVTQPSISTPDPLTFCLGGSALLTASSAASYLWSNGSTLQNITASSTGSYFVTVTNASGCTASSSPLNIVVNPTYSSSVNRFIASGSSYTLPNGQIVSVAGTYNSVFQTILGCDSIIITNLSVVIVDDNNLCTTDACNLQTGVITHTAVNVDDGNPCTIDGCNPLTGVYHTLIAEICGNGIDDNCNGQIDEGCSVTLNLRVLIDGFYLGGGLMQATIDPVNYPTICDTVTVELHSSVSPFALIQTDKKTINVSGNGVFVFPSSVQGLSFYIVIKHRNALETWSALPVLFNSTSISYSFTTALNKAYGNNMKNLGAGNFGVYSGDVIKNGIINSSDLSEIETKSTQFLTGYSSSDATGNGIVESTDFSVVENNLGISLMRP